MRLAYQSTLVLFVLLAVLPLAAQSNDQCKHRFSVVSKDALNNVAQGLSPANQKWFQDKLQRKYLGICYAAPDPSVPVVFYLWARPAVYHGTRVHTSTSTQPVQGTVTDDSGNHADFSGTTTTESSTTVPYSVDYQILMLSLETKGTDGKWQVRHNFQGKTLHPTMYGFCVKNCHPVHSLLEHAVKWMSEGGLSDPMQTVLPPEESPLKK